MTDDAKPATGSVAAVIVAAGRGLRAGGSRGGVPKQYRPLAGQSALARTLRTFRAVADIAPIQVVIHPDDRAHYAAAVRGLDLPPPVDGGATRQASVLAALEALAPASPAFVLMHDAVRPFATPALLVRAIAAARASGAAVPALPVADTIKSVDEAGRIVATLPRAPLRAIQTPQGFAFAPLLAAHRRAHAEGRDDFPDDAALAEWAGLAVSTFPGEAANIKLTTPEDFARAETMLQPSDIRTGLGFDVHAFVPGDRVMLGGIAIAHDRALSGHSDADVVLHALVDAILGALADGDIGTHFPPSDPQWKGAASDRFLAFAAERVAARGGVIAHLDVTVVCEAPKIGPHRDAMRARIAGIAGIDVGRVAVKATTSEGLGFTGRREGIAAYATATIRLPAG